jgi:STE24 endopeptidase
MSLPPPQSAPDTAPARQYNRIRRWLSVADVALGALFLVLLLTLHWTNRLRDWSFDLSGQRYALALLAYVAMLTLITQLIGLPLDFYSFRLEHRYQLSNQKLGSWLWDQLKEWLVGLVLGALVLELIYFTIRHAPDLWWLIAWVVVMGLFVVFAQLAPVLLLPLFYKFVPLEDDSLKQRLVKLTRVRGVYEWKLSEKSKKANAALTGLGATRASSSRTRCSRTTPATRSRRCWRTNSATTSTNTSSRASWCRRASRSSDSGPRIACCATPSSSASGSDCAA